MTDAQPEARSSAAVRLPWARRWLLAGLTLAPLVLVLLRVAFSQDWEDLFNGLGLLFCLLLLLVALLWLLAPLRWARGGAVALGLIYLVIALGFARDFAPGGSTLTVFLPALSCFLPLLIRR